MVVVAVDAPVLAALGPDLDRVIRGWIWMDGTWMDVDGRSNFDFLRLARDLDKILGRESRLVI